VRRLVNQTSATRQTLLFSATLDGPIDKLVRDYQRSPVRHEVSPADMEWGEIHHIFWSVEADNRVAVTADTVTARGPALVFCRTKYGADRLYRRLARLGLSTAAIHGDRNQSQRERALAAFRSGRLDVLVATDVAARGIHVDAVPLVVHYDPPAGATDYVHRSGRTGRAGADGIIISLVGHGHIGKVRGLQQQLGLTPGISSPDVSALPVVAEFARTPRGPHAAAAIDATTRRAQAVAPTHRRPVQRRRRRSNRR
jgi:superfamily II DNA/RNA helicase